MNNYKKYFIVKAIGFFSARNNDELSLEPRDVLQVIKKLDKYWYLGLRDEVKGKFPSSKVVEVHIEHELKNSIGIYISNATFNKQEDGDLGLNKNDIIIATRKIDEQWLEGKLLNVPNQGIFPISYTWKLKDNLDEFAAVNLNRPPINCLTYAIVLHSMEAQLDDELDLKKDDTVIIHGDQDSMYYRGELMNGKTGIFPKSFVSIIKNINSTNNSSCNSTTVSENLSSNHQHPIDNQNYEKDNLPSYNEATSWFNNLQTDIPSYGRTLYAFKAENSNEISFKENQIVNLIKYIDENWIEIELDNCIGLAPKNYIEIIVDCSNAPNFNDSKEDEYCNEIEEEENCCESEENNVEVEEFASETWAKVLYDFKAQMNGDLNLKEGDKIRLLRKFNNNWVEAYNETELGICPLNYIQILSPYESATTRPTSSNLVNHSIATKRLADNLIEFSPEKKEMLNRNQQFETQFTLDEFTNIYDKPRPANYDVLHELENDYQLTVFKDNSSASARTTQSITNNQTNQSINNKSKTNRLENSNSFIRNDVETNYLKKSERTRQDNSFDNPNYSSSSIYENPNRNETNHESNNSKNNRSSFINELNKNLPKQRPAPETPKRPALPPLPLLPPTPKINKRNNLNNQNNKSFNKSNETLASLNNNSTESSHKTPEINRSYINKNYSYNNDEKERSSVNAFRNSTTSDTSSTAAATSNEDSDDSKLTNNRLAKMAEQRQCIITELLQTEKDYRQALEICSRTFLRNEKFTIALKERNLDLKSIFSNLDEIIEVSQKLNDRLLSESVKDAKCQLIGKCFLDLERLMSNAYGVYCRNHDDVVPVFQKYEQDVEINRFFQRGLDEMRSNCSNFFDIPSILIKPVQRILKYPLMVNELIKCTPNDNADYECLQSALRMITDLATNINEFKRRNYIVCKYRKEAERSNSFSSKLSKLNMHTIKKKYSRFNYGLKSTIGLGNKSTDLEFQTEFSKFRSLEKSIKAFLKNIGFLVEQLDVYVKITFSLIEEMVNLYGDKCKQQRLIEKAKSCHYEILNKSINELKNKIEIYITDTLKRLLEKFAKPENLIKKRKDKSIDLECANNRFQSNRDGPRSKAFKDEFTVAKEVYEALNQQLIQDLPMFSSFGTEIFTNCIVAFITFYKKFIGNIVKQMLGNWIDLSFN